MALITNKMEIQMMNFQAAVAPQGRDIHSFVSKSFSAVSLLVNSGHLTSRKEVQDHIDMIVATASVYIDDQLYGTDARRANRPRKGK